MAASKHSFFLLGGSFLSYLQPYLADIGSISGQCVGISPLSKLNISSKEKNDGLTEWLPELSEKLDKCNSEYLLIDLQLAEQKLLSLGNGYIAATPENLPLLGDAEAAVFDPRFIPQPTIDTLLDQFTSVILSHFPADKIILIHTPHPSFWLAGNNLRVNQEYTATETQKQWLINLELSFQKKTNCHYLDVTKFYFYRKEIGKPLTDAVYEEECYLDVSERVSAIVTGDSIWSERPNFAYSLKRYTAYNFTLQKKALKLFLNPKNFLDRLILSSPPLFVHKYREQLILLDGLNWYTPKQALRTLVSYTPDSELTKICTAFSAVINGDYKDSSIDYALMFRNGIVPEELVAYLKKYFTGKKGVLPVQINQYNAGYYFAKMTGADPGIYSTPSTIPLPTVVDIFGSCISRTAFNVADNDFAVNHYWFHVPPLEPMNPKVEYSPDLFPGKVSWTDRLTRQQFDRSVFEAIENSDAEWLVVDLYFLISPNMYIYKNSIFSDFDGRISRSLKAKKIALWRVPNVFKSHDELFAALEPWLNLIKKKYGDKIILVDGQRLDYCIGDDDRIYQQPKSSGCNGFMRKAFDYVQKKLNCYGITIGKNFLPDELGYMRNTPTHKEDVGYFATHDIISYIVRSCPEQRIFDRYPGHIHMVHLERLAKSNSISKIKTALPLNDLDIAVLKLGYDNMLCWHDELSELFDSYDGGPLRPKKLFASISDSALQKALLAASSDNTPLPDETIDADYSPYQEGSAIFSGTLGMCELPTFPTLKFKKPTVDDFQVHLQWIAKANLSVLVFRRGRNTAWELIGESSTGEYSDQTVSASSEYWYCLGTKFASDGNLTRFVGGFCGTRAVRIPARTM